MKKLNFKKIPIELLLCLAILVAYLPFLNLRVLRMAGDEKVYITQAVEMARSGSWFVQTLADEPSYYKGPFHYPFIRLGMMIFGNQLIAGVWMNALFAVLAALAMYRLGRRFWDEKSSFILGAATALNVGVFSHAVVSQMEVELLAFYAFAAAALGMAQPSKSKSDLAKFWKQDLPFWAVAGVAGWIKSPVHSVLIGLSGILFWAMTGQLKLRIRNLGSWLSALTGVAICIGGYLPAILLDFKNFYETFIIRENVGKPNTGRTWDYVVVPLLHFALPWTLGILAAIYFAFKKGRKNLNTAARLGIAVAIPSILFWCFWGYKGQNYNLPTIPGLLLFAWGVLQGKLPRWTLKTVGALGIVVALAVIALVVRFWPLPDWWNLGWVIFALIGISIFVFAFLFEDTSKPLVVTIGTVAFFIAFGALIAPLGEREMIHPRRFIKENPKVTLHYYNLNPSIWSEWALLQLTLHRPVYGIHKPKQLREAFKPGHAILIKEQEALKRVVEEWKKNPIPGVKPEVSPWIRWLTKGKSIDGKSRWKTAWLNRDLGELERTCFIFYIPQK